MNITVVTTYPEQGTKNIGDALITNTTLNFLGDMFDLSQCNVSKVWRADSWDSVKDRVESSDLIVFACLAIRPNMTQKEYPYLWQVIRSGVPIAVLAAGTGLKVGVQNFDMLSGFTADTLEALRVLSKVAKAFTTRGALTDQFCRQAGISSILTGDIAFYDDRFQSRPFRVNDDIKSIVVSDPHYGSFFWPTFEYLINELRVIFPAASIEVLLHGENSLVERNLGHRNIGYKRIYEDAEHGLDAYDMYDLHVGFRVHGHVSALNRRIPSYLLEQDGRGADYGLTIDRPIAVPCYVSKLKGSRLSRIARSIPGNASADNVNVEAVNKVCAMINKDKSNGFAKFLGLESQLVGFKESFSTLKIADVMNSEVCDAER